MAEAKRKCSVGTDGSMRPATKTKSPNIAPNLFPSLDETALASLTQKIGKKLQDHRATTNSSQKKSKSSVTRAKKDEDGFYQKLGGKNNSSNSKKRDHRGHVIGGEDKDGRTTQSKDNTNCGDGVLKQEILALGGDQADYDLLKDLDSESELECHNTPARSKGQPDENVLRKDLAEIMKNSGQVDNKPYKEKEGIEMEDIEGDIPSTLISKQIENTARRETITSTLSAKDDGRMMPRGYSQLVSHSVPMNENEWLTRLHRQFHRDQTGIILCRPLYLPLSRLPVFRTLFLIGYTSMQSLF
jgi:hypothetical protein